MSGSMPDVHPVGPSKVSNVTFFSRRKLQSGVLARVRQFPRLAAWSSQTQAPPLQMLAFGRAWQYVQPPMCRSGTFHENQLVSVSHHRSVSTSSWKSSSAGTSSDRCARGQLVKVYPSALIRSPSLIGAAASGGRPDAHGGTGQLGFPGDPAPQGEDVPLVGNGPAGPPPPRRPGRPATESVADPATVRGR